MAGDELVRRLLAHLDKVEQDLQEHNRDPYAGLSDDELHQERVHPAYEYETVTVGRKSYEDDRPPGEGWERNITSVDPQGWERFDYTEDSYWRRLRPDGSRSSWKPSDWVVEGLRMVRAHRDIVRLYQDADTALALAVWFNRTARTPERLTDSETMAGLRATAVAFRRAVVSLADGYGIEAGGDV